MKAFIQSIDHPEVSDEFDIIDIREFLSDMEPVDVQISDEAGLYVNENENEYQLEICLPDFQKENFTVEVNENRVMTIQAEKEFLSITDNEDGAEEEFGDENYSRSFVLPQDADDQNIEAYYQGHVLTVVIPKLQ